MDKHPINKDYKTNLSKLLFLLLLTRSKMSALLTLDAFPAQPEDTVGVILSPLELPTMLGSPPLLSTFTAGRAFKSGGVLVASPCLHGREMWHTWPGSCCAWPDGDELEMAAGCPGFSQPPQDWSERRHLLLLVVEGEEKSEFTVVCYAKCLSVVAASAK